MGCEKMFYKNGWTVLDFIQDGFNSCKEDNQPWLLDNSKFVIQQFTGLKDKNSKEIWEGDICKFAYNHELEAENVIIQYDNDTARFEAGNGKKGYELISWAYIPCQSVQVIGNIFENPELLNA